MLDGFKKFIMRGNVVDLAVGVVIGASFGTVVTSLVADMLMPIIAALFKTPDFSKLALNINGSALMYGNFINAIVGFVIVAAAIYFFVVIPLGKLTARMHKPEVATTKACDQCCSEIDLKAKRCAFCTATLS